MSYLHSKGVLHGDLTGGNVLLVEGDTELSPDRLRAKVADFGLSRSLQVASRLETETYGTVTHMPPELLVDGIMSKAGDVFAFGVLLWWMYTGQHPWDEYRQAQIIYRIATLKETLQCTDETPAGYKELVSWCFEYDRHDRPTFEQVATAL
eukprot:jgi/Astpho2/3854/gw1.00062.112.1_t